MIDTIGTETIKHLCQFAIADALNQMSVSGGRNQISVRDSRAIVFEGSVEFEFVLNMSTRLRVGARQRARPQGHKRTE